MPGLTTFGTAVAVESPWGLMREVYGPHMLGANRQVVARRLLNSFRTLNADKLTPLGPKWASKIKGHWSLKLPPIAAARQQVPEFQKRFMLKRIAQIRAAIQKSIHERKDEANWIKNTQAPGSKTIELMDRMRKWIDQDYDRNSQVAGLMAAARALLAGPIIAFWVLPVGIGHDTIAGHIFQFRVWFLNHSPARDKHIALDRELRALEAKLRAQKAKAKR